MKTGINWVQDGTGKDDINVIDGMDKMSARVRQIVDEAFDRGVKTPHNVITRVEVIDGEGRSYQNHEVKALELSYQDDGRTLKILIIDDQEPNFDKCDELHAKFPRRVR